MGHVAAFWDAGTPPATVSAGGGTTLLSSPNGGTSPPLTFAGGFTPTSPDVAVKILYRATGPGTLPLTVTVCGVAVTAQDSAEGGASGRCGVWIGTARGLTVGVPGDVSILASNQIGKVAVRITNIVNWGGLIGDHEALTPHSASPVQGVSTALTLVGGTSLLLGIAGVADADCYPLSVPLWSPSSEVTVGGSPGASVDAAFCHRSGGAVGSTATLAASSAVGWTDWAVAALELR